MSEYTVEGNEDWIFVPHLFLSSYRRLKINDQEEWLH